MKTITIITITGSCAFTPADGQRLYNLLYPILKEGQSVTLNFEGITAMTSVFLNFSLGHLLKDFDVDKRIFFEGLDKFQQALINKVLDNAKQHYSSYPSSHQSQVS